jgi:DHA1 family tetracycline resistance protein-like MFS transporter
MNHSINKHALIFGFTTVFLTGLGLTIVSPVLPFLVAPYTEDATQQATAVTMLMAIYALSVFLAAPVLGALSDRFGRRPVLILSLIGSAVGYFIFGLGGALWILFLGRIIEGITGGEISAIFAYFADITPANERTKFFGWISALVGLGTALGPIIGGALATFGNRVPLFVGAAITLFNAIYGYFFMPESSKKSDCTTRISIKQLHPLTQLTHAFSFPKIKWLLITGFLVWLPNGSLQAIFSQFSIDTFSWQPVMIGFTFSIIGVLDIFSQALIMPRLLKVLTDKQIAILGMISEITGYLFIALSAFTKLPPIFIIGMIFFGLGDAIFSPSFNGMLSKSVVATEQGRIQGSAQSIQALARIFGPVVGGQMYATFSHSSPAVMGIFMLFLGIIVAKAIK